MYNSVLLKIGILYNLVTDITCISLFHKTDTKYNIFVILFTQQENTKLFFFKNILFLEFCHFYTDMIDNHPVKKINILI